MVSTEKYQQWPSMRYQNIRWCIKTSIDVYGILHCRPIDRGNLILTLTLDTTLTPTLLLTLNLTLMIKPKPNSEVEGLEGVQVNILPLFWGVAVSDVCNEQRSSGVLTVNKRKRNLLYNHKTL